MRSMVLLVKVRWERGSVERVDLHQDLVDIPVAAAAEESLSAFSTSPSNNVGFPDTQQQQQQLPQLPPKPATTKLHPDAPEFKFREYPEECELCLAGILDQAGAESPNYPIVLFKIENVHKTEKFGVMAPNL